MILNNNELNFIKINEGPYIIGINKEIIETIYNTPVSQEIKKSYLLNSHPKHNVKINNFSISKRLITLSEFENFVDATNYKTEAEQEGWGWIWDDRWRKMEGVTWQNPFKSEADEIYNDNKNIIPVLMISCNDAQEYCKWISNEKISVRLPTEAEWEIFAGIKNVKSMPDYNEIPINKMENTSIKHVIKLRDESEKNREEHEPGLIWEWTGDWFDTYPGGITNKEFGCTYKVLRGGSVYSHALQKTKEYRFRRCPTARSPYYGFRVVIE